ncbi:Cerato-platanin [Lactarius quietus]|nr:Cerato-platanin [Lactarius quietus]
MKFASTFISLAALFSVTSAYIVRYNTIYDDPSTSLNDVACSNGDNGLESKGPGSGFQTFGDLPTFPGIGGVFAVKGWNSPECGSCWRLKYSGTGKHIHVTAIDTISDGFDISLKAMNILTNGKAVQLDSIDVAAHQVPESFCGMI